MSLGQHGGGSQPELSSSGSTLEASPLLGAVEALVGSCPIRELAEFPTPPLSTLGGVFKGDTGGGPMRGGRVRRPSEVPTGPIC